jgi:hypothetical protein
MKIRRVMRHCPCGQIQCVGIAPMNAIAAYHAAHGPCPKCRNIGGNRVFWFASEEVHVEPAASRLPAMERLQ